MLWPTELNAGERYTLDQIHKSNEVDLIPINNEGDSNKGIDERLRVDDKQLRNEGDNDSPIRKLGSFDDFDIVDEDDDTGVFSTEVGGETLMFGGDFEMQDGVLTINNFDIEGSESNKVGLTALRNLANLIGNAMNVNQVIINGATRTTGANPGKKSSLTFEIN
ncbi:hypothetical protein [Nonlabens xiamenensis]|uniref:hypothetical protein n=1 Tax=Nonlabens xiamenensis TaxID=2341043 RepID=UPI000F614224|nr:hypothetical protein [Nonlabens xiamenensis]